ncbi:MAG: hypothetical protein KF869_12900 [Phycisphaeraceae bacterium]|nr:hypothetical protein [Phycisphaeraceae bacterium]
MAQVATFTPLGVSPGHPHAVVFDISADGETVVGVVQLPSSPYRRGFVWRNGQISLLMASPNGPGFNGEVVTRVSADGHVIIGTEGSGQGIRWVDGVVEILAPPPGGWTGTRPTAVSQDGSIFFASWLRFESGVWTGTPLVETLDCTDSGHVHVGLWIPPQSSSNLLAIHASDGTVIVPQPTLSGSSVSCRISSRGEFLVCTQAGTPFLWHFGQPGVTLLEWPLGLTYMTFVGGISDDGRIVVGSWVNSPENLLLYGSPLIPPYVYPALLWEASRGTRSIENVLRQLGVDIGDWRLVGATGCSSDGLTIAGTGVNPQGQLEGWRVTLPGIPPSPDFDNSRVLDVADVFAFLTVWFSGGVLADFNLDGMIDVSDIFQFLQFWFGQLL